MMSDMGTMSGSPCPYCSRYHGSGIACGRLEYLGPDSHAACRAERDAAKAEIAALKTLLADAAAAATVERSHCTRLSTRATELTRDVETYKDAQAVAAGELHDVAEALGCHAEDAVDRARELRALLDRLTTTT